MSHRDHTPLTPEERELAQKLSRLDAHAAPSAALDAKILAAARDGVDPAAAPAREPLRAKRRRWPLGLGVAASLVVAVGIAWQLRPQPETPRMQALSDSGIAPEAAPATAPPGAPPPAPPSPPKSMRAAPPAPPADTAAVAAPPANALGQRQPTTDDAARASAKRAAARREDAPPSPPPQAEPERSVADAPPPPPAPPAPPSPAPVAPAAVEPASAPAPTAQAADAAAPVGERRAAAATRPEQTPAPAGATTGEAGSDRAASALARQRILLDPPLDPPLELPADEVNGFADQPLDNRPPASADSPEVREHWLRRIRELRDAGKLDAARASLREFVRRHPRAEVPVDLRPLLPDE